MMSLDQVVARLRELSTEGVTRRLTPDELEEYAYLSSVAFDALTEVVGYGRDFWVRQIRLGLDNLDGIVGDVVAADVFSKVGVHSPELAAENER